MLVSSDPAPEHDVGASVPALTLDAEDLAQISAAESFISSDCPDAHLSMARLVLGVLYKHYNPDKLPGVENLLAKHAVDALRIIPRVAAKYGFGIRRTLEARSLLDYLAALFRDPLP